MRARKRILIVEDEASIRALCRRILSRTPHESVFASCVEEAAAAVGASSGFDLLVTDMKLPDGDGVDVIETLRRLGCGAPVLVVTGSPLSPQRWEKISALGVTQNDILLKPFEIRDYLAAMESRLARGETDRP